MSTEPNRSFVETITFFCAAVPPLRLLLVVFFCTGHRRAGRGADERIGGA